MEEDNNEEISLSPNQQKVVSHSNELDSFSKFLREQITMDNEMTQVKLNGALDLLSDGLIHIDRIISKNPKYAINPRIQAALKNCLSSVSKAIKALCFVNDTCRSDVFGAITDICRLYEQTLSQNKLSKGIPQAMVLLQKTRVLIFPLLFPEKKEDIS